MKTPPAFWSAPDGRAHTLARLLRPVGSLYGRVVASKLNRPSAPCAVPVICVGNITLGGVGKTPFTDELCRLLTERGETPHILMRGYGGTEKGPVQITPEHTAADVGDEAVMLGADWPVWVSRNRPDGAARAAAAGASVIVMDDGFQNPSLEKTISLVLIDAATGLGNGLIFPAGPLRECPHEALRRASAVVMVHQGEHEPASDIPALQSYQGARLSIRINADIATLPPDTRFLAFAGIGRPEKFFGGLRESGVTLVDTAGFPDHHPYAGEDIRALRARAAAHQAALVTTTKDLARLSSDQREGIYTAPARVHGIDSVLLHGLLDQALEHEDRA